MILYNVTVKILKAIEHEWLDWMRTRHIPDVIATGHFTDHRICKLLEHDDEESATFVIQYFCPSLHKYNHYILHDAPRLREEHEQLFKDKYVAFRTVMEVLK